MATEDQARVTTIQAVVSCDSIPGGPHAVSVPSPLSSLEPAVWYRFELAALRNDEQRTEAEIRALIRDEVQTILDERD